MSSCSNTASSIQTDEQNMKIPYFKMNIYNKSLWQLRGGRPSLHNYTQPTDFINWANESAIGLQLSFWQNSIFGQRYKHTEAFSPQLNSNYWAIRTFYYSTNTITKHWHFSKEWTKKNALWFQELNVTRLPYFQSDTHNGKKSESFKRLQGKIFPWCAQLLFYT